MLKSMEKVSENCRIGITAVHCFQKNRRITSAIPRFGTSMGNLLVMYHGTPNGEYKMNLDFSLVCEKRRTLDAVFNEMSRRGIIDDFELGQKSVVKINEIIRKHGFETACALCFVDAKRFRQASTGFFCHYKCLWEKCASAISQWKQYSLHWPWQKKNQ